MDWKEKVFKNFTLYAVTDLRAGTEAELKKIELAYRGGADIVQLRSKILPDAELLRIGAKAGKIALKYRKLFFVNDRIDLAILLKADGIHLGQDDIPLPEARRLARRAGMKFRFGISTHDLRQALAAERQGVDYIGIGPVFATPTKPGRKGIGLKLVRQIARRIRIPFVPIGGIDLENCGDVIRAGATRVAVVRAIFEAEDPMRAAQEFKDFLDERVQLKRV